jgi:DNA polymerase-3 subunit epsilon
MLNIALEIPLVSIDTETTGVNRQIDRVIQIGVVKLSPDGEVKKWQTYINPEEPIPPESTEIHGITDEMVKDAPPFKNIAGRLAKALTMVDITGFNVYFDISMLKAEFRRANVLIPGLEACRVIDVQKIYRKYHKRKLKNAVKLYLNEDMIGAHDALVDAEYSLRVLAAQLELYPELPKSVGELNALLEAPSGNKVDAEGKLVWRNGEICLNFGKTPGRPLRLVEKKYLKWVIAGDFSRQVKVYCQDALDGKFYKR